MSTLAKNLELSDVEHLMKAFRSVTKEEFRYVLAASIGADKAYADEKYPLFQNAPLLYVTSRNPKKQGEALLRYALHGKPSTD